jgi:deazaflavin-dependent oxidoreductase (nitroreductase family)
MLLLDHVGAKGGLPKHPAWFHNLRANPLTYVQVGAERRRVRARVATPAARDRLWGSPSPSGRATRTIGGGPNARSRW